MYVIQFLQELVPYSDVTLMGAENLAMVFAPSFLRCPYQDYNKALTAADKEKAFILELIRTLPRDAGLQRTVQKQSQPQVENSQSIPTQQPPEVAEPATPPIPPSETIADSKAQATPPETPSSGETSKFTHPLQDEMDDMEAPPDYEALSPKVAGKRDHGGLKPAAVPVKAAAPGRGFCHDVIHVKCSVTLPSKPAATPPFKTATPCKT